MSQPEESPTTFIRVSIRNAAGEVITSTDSEPHRAEQIGAVDVDFEVNGEPFNVQVSFVPEVVPKVAR